MSRFHAPARNSLKMPLPLSRSPLPPTAIELSLRRDDPTPPSPPTKGGEGRGEEGCWPNSETPLALHRLRADRELVCDAMVMQRSDEALHCRWPATPRQRCTGQGLRRAT